MSESGLSKAATTILIAATLIAGSWSASSQPSVLNDQETVLTRARELLHAFYPELFGKHAFLHVSVTQDIDHNWRQLYAIGFDVMPYNPLSERMLNPPVDAKTGKRLPPPPNSFLRGQVSFNREGWLHQFEAAGEAALEKPNKEIHQLVQSHPDWSEADAVKALKQAGAHYGPSEKEQLIQSIHIGKLNRFIGRLKIKSVEFDPVELQWAIRVDAPTADEKDPGYTFFFEPFQGKLTAVVHALTGTIHESR